LPFLLALKLRMTVRQTDTMTGNQLKASASWDDVFAATMTTMYGRPVTIEGDGDARGM
jgi:hypothetical protein